MQKTLRVLIVEDEFLTLDSISLGLKELNYEVSGFAKDAQTALKILEEGLTDIAILDINIQGANDGIWLAEKIRLEYGIPFIFLSAYSDKKTVEKAMSTQPYAYLVKPFTKIDIYTALEVAITNYNLIHMKNTEAKVAIGKKAFKISDYLFVKKRAVYSKVFIKDILFIKSDSKYIELYVNDETFLLRYGLQEFYSLLPRTHFIQAHRSYVVNKDAVSHIGTHSLFINDHEIPLSLQRKDDFLKEFTLL